MLHESAITKIYDVCTCFALMQRSVKNAFAAATKDLGTINVLVYNASGGGFGKTVMEIDPEDMIQSFNVSCVGALNCTQVKHACIVSYNTARLNLFALNCRPRPSFQACLRAKDSGITRFRKKEQSFFLPQHPHSVAVRVPHNLHAANTHSAHSRRQVLVLVRVVLWVLVPDNVVETHKSSAYVLWSISSYLQSIAKEYGKHGIHAGTHHNCMLNTQRRPNLNAITNARASKCETRLHSGQSCCAEKTRRVACHAKICQHQRHRRDVFCVAPAVSPWLEQWSGHPSVPRGLDVLMLVRSARNV